LEATPSPTMAAVHSCSSEAAGGGWGQLFAGLLPCCAQAHAPFGPARRRRQAAPPTQSGQQRVLPDQRKDNPPCWRRQPARRSATGIAWGAMCTDCDSPRRAKRQPRENTIRMHLQVVGRRNVDGPAPPGALEQRAALASEGLHLKGVMWEAAVCVPTIP